MNVGLFTSPHLEVVNERIRLNNDYIADADLIRIMEKIEPVILELEAELNEKFYAFELLTTVAFIFSGKMPRCHYFRGRYWGTFRFDKCH